MSRMVWLRILVLVAVSIVLTGTPQFASAQRGGHGGGGGFHGGGGGFHGGGGGFHGGGSFGGFRGGAGGFHGGGGFGGFRGRGFDGFRGRGFGGFRGDRFFGGFGFPGYGYGFGFGPYWGYPYYYGYSPWWSPYGYYDPYDSYYYPDGPDYPQDNRYPRDNRDGCDYRHEDEHPCKPNNESVPAKPSSMDVPESSPERKYVNANSRDSRSAFSLVDYRSVAAIDPAAVTAAGASNHLSDSSTWQLPSRPRPAVRNVIQVLRAMPPDARQRQLNSGRYHSLSPEEREFLTNAMQPSQTPAPSTTR